MYLSKTSGNLNPRGQQPQQNLQVSTVRSFEGGLNATDTDLNMSPKYAKVLDNLERAIDGSLSVRPGTILIGTVNTDNTPIVNCYYFNQVVVTVQETGAIHGIAGDGSDTEFASGGVLFNGTQEANFTIFNSDLIIVNGRDKPVIISGDVFNANYMIPQYLVDLATLSNVNTPIGKYVIAHAQYTVIAGVATDPSKLFISQKDTSGTFFGDPPPNDAIILDLGPRVSLGSATITGLVAYRDKLLVTFERGVLPVNLGVYTGTPPLCTLQLMTVSSKSSGASVIGLSPVLGMTHSSVIMWE